MEVYTVAAKGGQIVGYEAQRDTLPGWLAPIVKEQINNHGFCLWNDGYFECIIYPTKEAAENAINWAINN